MRYPLLLRSTGDRYEQQLDVLALMALLPGAAGSLALRSITDSVLRSGVSLMMYAVKISLIVSVSGKTLTPDVNN
jgi:hypothetical protein